MQLVDVDGDQDDGKAFDSPSNNRGFNGGRLRFKSLFGKRALWRRIFFASKKVRSIILLNVITIIYGKLLKFEIFVVLLFFYSSLYELIVPVILILAA